MLTNSPKLPFRLIVILLINCLFANGQIFTQNPTNGSILITPKGVVGSSYTSNITSNVALGEETLKFNTSGSWNTAIGRVALKNNTTGNQNTAVGNGALEANSTGFQNTAIGEQALSFNQTGSQNTGLGWRSLMQRTISHSSIPISNCI